MTNFMPVCVALLSMATCPGMGLAVDSATTNPSSNISAMKAHIDELVVKRDWAGVKSVVLAAPISSTENERAWGDRARYAVNRLADSRHPMANATRRELALGAIAQMEKLTLEQAVDISKQLSPYEPVSGDIEQWAATRKKLAETWLAVLKRIDSQIDATWSNDRQPFSPPPGAFASGLAPSQIKDPADRAAYETWLADRKARAQRGVQQIDARRLREQWIGIAASYLTEAYTYKPRHEAQVRQLVEQANLTAPTKELLMSRLQSLMND